MNIDWTKKSIDEIKEELRTLSHNYQLHAYGIKEEFLVVRGTIINEGEPPQNISRLSYCPKKFSSANNRANRAGETLFYGANNLLTCLLELKPKKGDNLYISYWWVKHPIHLVPVAYTKDVLQKLGSNLNILSFIEDPNYFSSIANDPRTKFFYEIFTKNDINEPATDYNSSIALAEHYFTPIILDRNADNSQFANTKADENGDTLKVIDALMYPSIQNNGNSHNFAIQSEFVDSCMAPVRLECYQINEDIFQPTITHFAQPPFLDKIKWFKTNNFVNWSINSELGPILIFLHEGVIKIYHTKHGLSIHHDKASPL